MNLQSRAFESTLELPVSVGTPLACPHSMPVQELVVWTPYRVIGAVLMALLYVPRTALLAPAAIRMGRGRRA